jgi:hypothetical protein
MKSSNLRTPRIHSWEYVSYRKGRLKTKKSEKDRAKTTSTLKIKAKAVKTKKKTKENKMEEGQEPDIQGEVIRGNIKEVPMPSLVNNKCGTFGCSKKAMRGKAYCSECIRNIESV